MSHVADVKTTQNFYNGTSTVNGNLAVYWEKPVIQPNEQFKVGRFFSMPNSCPIIILPSSYSGGIRLWNP